MNCRDIHSLLALAQIKCPYQISFILLDTPNALPLAMSELRNKRITILDISGFGFGMVSVCKLLSVLDIVTWGYEYRNSGRTDDRVTTRRWASPSLGRSDIAFGLGDNRVCPGQM